MIIKSEVKWLPLLVAIIAGIASMILLGITFSLVFPIEALIDNWLLMIFFIFSFAYFITGFIVGVWTNWKGWLYGTTSASCVFFVNILLFINIENISASPIFIISIFLAWFFSMIIGGFGGFIGEKFSEKIRN